LVTGRWHWLVQISIPVRSAGVEFDLPPTTMSWGARHSYLTDPDGHTISFVQSPA
jgi:catechol 2,3-dioxygenase-like lactoylglutathione lyase family enzyme